MLNNHEDITLNIEYDENGNVKSMTSDNDAVTVMFETLLKMMSAENRSKFTDIVNKTVY